MSTCPSSGGISTTHSASALFDWEWIPEIKSVLSSPICIILFANQSITANKGAFIFTIANKERS